MTNSTTDGGQQTPLPSFAELIRTYADENDDQPPPVPVSLAAVLAGATDPMQVIHYLGGLGIEIRCLDDLLKINNDPSEDELQAFCCIEGIALSIASDAVWILFVR